MIVLQVELWILDLINFAYTVTWFYVHIVKTKMILLISIVSGENIIMGDKTREI